MRHTWDRGLNKTTKREFPQFDASVISDVVSDRESGNIRVRLTSAISTKNVDFWITLLRL